MKRFFSWSYGIVLWEVTTLGGTPYPSIAMPQLYNILKQGYRMESPHNCPEEIYGVMVMCWQEKPETRPSFTLIADYFDWMLAEAANYNAVSLGSASKRATNFRIWKSTAQTRPTMTVIE